MVWKYDFQMSVCSATSMIPVHLLSVFSNLLAEPNYCESDPCQYGATCERGVGTYTCQCEAGFTGHNCETGKFEYHVTCNVSACGRFHNGWKGIRMFKYFVHFTINPDKLI